MDFRRNMELNIQNIGAKVFSARLAKVLNLNADQMLMQCQRACSEIWGDWAENNHEITAEVQDYYPKFKQNLAEKIFSSQKSAETSRCLANALSKQRGSKS